MRYIRGAFIATGLLVLVGLAAVTVIGPDIVVFLLSAPNHSFHDDDRADPPDYHRVDSWAAHPMGNPLQRPPATPADTSLQQVDVFFVHPTGYIRGEHWNSMLDSRSAAAHNTRWMMANMASVFSDFRVYAPRYREATIYAFFNVTGDDEKAALDLAYADVERAFDHFATHLNKTRPFILVGHSQGSYHGIRLLRDRIESSEHAGRLVAAYLAGGVTESLVAGVRTPICRSSDQTGCFVAWSTYADTYRANEAELNDRFVCVNPLNWLVNARAEPTPS